MISAEQAAQGVEHEGVEGEPSSICWSREGFRVLYALRGTPGLMQEIHLLRPCVSDMRTGREGVGRLLIQVRVCVFLRASRQSLGCEIVWMMSPSVVFVCE